MAPSSWLQSKKFETAYHNTIGIVIQKNSTSQTDMQNKLLLPDDKKLIFRAILEMSTYSEDSFFHAGMNNKSLRQDLNKRQIIENTIKDNCNVITDLDVVIKKAEDLGVIYPENGCWRLLKMLLE